VLTGSLNARKRYSNATWSWIFRWPCPTCPCPREHTYQKGRGAAFRAIPWKYGIRANWGCRKSCWTWRINRTGLVWVTGPTGAGKDTTLAAIDKPYLLISPDGHCIEDQSSWFFPIRKRSQTKEVYCRTRSSAGARQPWPGPLRLLSGGNARSGDDLYRFDCR
jgi:hypothetical protein